MSYRRHLPCYFENLQNMLSCFIIIGMQPCRQLWFGLSRFRDVRLGQQHHISMFYIHVHTKTASPLFWIFEKSHFEPIYCEFLLSSCTNKVFLMCVLRIIKNNDDNKSHNRGKNKEKVCQKCLQRGNCRPKLKHVIDYYGRD